MSSVLAAVLALPFGLARPAPVRPPPSRPIVAAELERLVGQSIERMAEQRYRIVDIAGEGAPRIGVVERRAGALWLREADGQVHRLSGPLATPRIAGPGYTVWIIGDLDRSGDLIARRLGVIEPAGALPSATQRRVDSNSLSAEPAMKP